jgi:ABC-2 type transport system permease protein
MNTLQITTSLKKEIWEFNKTLFWVPIIIGLFMLAMLVVQLLLIKDYQIDNILNTLTNLQDRGDFEHADKLVLGLISAVFAPFILVALVIQLHYFANCLFDERRELSIYFWRSLPVSDSLTVGVKLFTGALLIPGIFFLAATAVFMLVLLVIFIACIVLSVGFDISLWGLWLSADIFSSLASTWLNIVPYALWLFPVYAWLMLASAVAKKAPMLWAILPVIVVIIVEAFVASYFNLHSRFFANTIQSYFEFSRDMFPNNMSDIESTKFLLLSALSAKIDWVATIIGCALIYLTYWLRVNRSDS